ncbi:LamG-like jellyroll fold domain-containing protein [Aquimarina sp. 2201CG5-10]|uniref:LamG-like jellyroll fold domain-containing protein n=1 Tax=Aquimarina callyspongiae TaxID=3098150 RepID=UPI002AB5D11A|nr:LamG-like jellyroll fold domain-containing protein [Aquimarina sp. 2201CG5-10]MDY8136066.1 LamG-like jellyroll fold domain-containing protein [Aquimarina sp. 2201CG5-10]
MSIISIRRMFVCIITIFAVTLYSCKQEKKPEETPVTITDHGNADLKKALTFYASFDKGVDADFSLGDARMYTVPNRKAIDSAKVGLHKPDISRQEGKGKYGSGLVFTEDSKGNIYYPSEKNIAYSKENWSGAVSFWLSLDPATDLEPGYCDPIQITDVSYNDAAIWVDFTKENPRDFRLGVIGDRNVWNPNPEGPDNENPLFNKRLTGVKNPPFGSDQWTHILINFSNLNTSNGQASLYMNGKLKGTRKNIDTPFTWELSKSNIYLGLGYIGLMDELSIFNRNLTDKEITTLYELENGVHSILE